MEVFCYLAVGRNEFSVASLFGDNAWDASEDTFDVEVGEGDVPDDVHAGEQVGRVRKLDVLEVGRPKLEVDSGIRGHGPTLGSEFAASQAAVGISVGGEEFGDAGGGLEDEGFVRLGVEGG